MKIVIIDYGLGNPLSIKNMLGKLGASAVISSDTGVLRSANKLILPGVGHFKTGVQNLQQKGLQAILHDLVLEEHIPILGICLGMQLMSKYSEEGDCAGLGWVNAVTQRFQYDDPNIKIPHMGWSDTFFKSIIQESRFEEIPPRFYYVHSYYVKCAEDGDILCEAEYNNFKFTSGFVKDNIMGVQFHPEKSHIFGKEFLNQFVSWVP